MIDGVTGVTACDDAAMWCPETKIQNTLPPLLTRSEKGARESLRGLLFFFAEKQTRSMSKFFSEFQPHVPCRLTPPWERFPAIKREPC